MNRQLKKMIKECRELEQKRHSMTVDNSTDDERKSAWLDILVKRKEITYRCADILGVKDEDDTHMIGSSVDRGNMLSYIRYGQSYYSRDGQGR